MPLRKSTFPQSSIFWPVVIALTWLLFGPLSTAQDRSGPITDALRANDYHHALELAHAAIEQSPSDPQLWTLQGVAYSAQGKKQEALASFRNALKLAPDHLPALQQEAQLHYETNNMAAIPVLQHILRLRPGDPMSHAMIAVLEYRHGNCKSAVVHFKASGNLLDSQRDGLHAYATCLVRLKQLDAAAKVFERAVAVEASDPQERNVLASIQLMNHQPQAALETLKPLLEKNPNSETLELASSAYEESSDTENSVNMLRQAILLDPRNVGPYLDFAYIAYAHQSFQVGINVLTDGIGQQPDSAQLYFARGMLYTQLADYEKAEADFAKSYELDPNQSLTAAAQGLLAVQQNDLDRALASARERLARKPGDPVLLYLQADILAQKGVEPGTAEFQSALRSAERAVALRPSLAPAREVLAKLYMQSGQNEQAIVQCRRAMQIDPKDQTSLYRLIQLLRKNGKNAELPELLKRLAELRQGTAKAQRQRYGYKLVEGDSQP
jgi:tetratricopeptide (TPR) repeat protein